MKFLSYLIALTFLIRIDCNAQESSSDPRQAAEAFYTELRSHRVEGLPQGKAWHKIKSYLTPDLKDRFVKARHTQREFIKKNPGEKPPWIEGDLFSSLFEGPQKFTIGVASIRDGRAEVSVHLFSKQGGTTTRWTDTLLLRKIHNKWLLEDIRYGGNWAFASKGKLAEVLSK